MGQWLLPNGYLWSVRVWESRGTLITSRERQSLLIRQQRWIIAEGDAKYLLAFSDLFVWHRAKQSGIFNLFPLFQTKVKLIVSGKGIFADWVPGSAKVRHRISYSKNCGGESCWKVDTTCYLLGKVGLGKAPAWGRFDNVKGPLLKESKCHWGFSGSSTRKRQNSVVVMSPLITFNLVSSLSSWQKLWLD